jgi:hypothetical protein
VREEPRSLWMYTFSKKIFHRTNTITFACNFYPHCQHVSPEDYLGIWSAIVFSDTCPTFNTRNTRSRERKCRIGSCVLV